jgi:hypothetical protein
MSEQFKFFCYGTYEYNKKRKKSKLQKINKNKINSFATLSEIIPSCFKHSIAIYEN